MECPFCKKIYDDEFNFCPWCGNEKPEISYDVESFESENKILEEDTIVFEKQFRDIEEELNILQEDIKNYEKLEIENNKILSSESVYNKENYTEEELETIYSNVFDEENGYFYEKLQSSSDIRCPNCGSKKFLSDYDRGEVVCTRCGLLVNEHLLDMGRPWMFTNEKNSREHLKFY